MNLTESATAFLTSIFPAAEGFPGSPDRDAGFPRRDIPEGHSGASRAYYAVPGTLPPWQIACYCVVAAYPPPHRIPAFGYDRLDGRYCFAVHSVYSQGRPSRSNEPFGRLGAVQRSEVKDLAKLDDNAFLATVVHELRAPLNACLMSLNLLELKAAQTGEVLRCAEVIKRNLERQARLIGDLADIAQVATDGIDVLPDPVDACQLVEAAIDSSRSAAAEHSVGIEWTEPQRTYPLAADPDRLTAAIATLIEYLVAGAPAGGRIALQLLDADDNLELRFRRMEPEDGLDVPSSPPDKPIPEPKGFVVRLAIVEQVLEAHGGGFERDAAGFNMRLPLHTG